ncbi:FecCD family ABC transporter permease [Zymobacter sp. IVIA_5232.4 C2]|uniref:FecCD family ABC transporter permease n=1 Tax=Zymobacter sp. IVIA_5232.4 C2 TaxID=3394855 RepID=UPI0039C442C4
MKTSIHAQRVMLLLGITLVGAVAIGACSGALGLPLSLDLGAPQWRLWWQLRLPRVLQGLLIGAMLAAGGTAMQGLFRNPLADPTLLGQANGAALAVALWVVVFDSLQLDLPLPMQAIAGFIGALAVSLIIFHRGRHHQGSSAMMMLLLTGMAISILAGAISGLLAFLASDEQLRQLSLWGMGSLAHAPWSAAIVALIIIPLALLSLLKSAPGLDLMQLGEHTAYTAGLDTARLKRRVILATSLGVGLSVALAGIIGFLGLMIPHALRLVLGPSHRYLMPASMLAGATLLVMADALARTLILPAELPVGLLISLLGGPYFLWQLRPIGRTT